MRPSPRLLPSLAIAPTRSRGSCALLLLIISVVAKAQPDYGKIVNEGLEKGVMIGLGAKTKQQTDLIKTIMKPEGKGKIETKEGDLKIDTQNIESLKQAEEFRKNYKKPKYCEEPEREEIRIQCANEYIKARKSTSNQNKVTSNQTVTRNQ